MVGAIADTPGVHGIALAPALNRGFISAGRGGFIVEFELTTLARLKEIPVTGENPDAILYEPSTERVDQHFFCHGAHEHVGMREERSPGTMR